MTTNYPLGRVVGVGVYRADVVVIRESYGAPPPRGDRQEISQFSSRARQRLRFVAMNTDVVFRTMITLTYPSEYPSDGRTVKTHFHAFLTWLARDIGVRPDYLWFLEFQARGAPHYHILIDWKLPMHLPERSSFRFRVSSAWYRIVGSKDVRHLQAGTRVETIRKPDGARRYAVKYAMKMKQKHVPSEYRNVGRFWGCSKRVVPKVGRTIRATDDDIRGRLEGWAYAPAQARPLFTVLYGCAERFLDNPDVSE